MALQREQVVQTAEKYVSRGKIEPAIKEYKKLLAENPNDINTLNRVGDLYARIQRIDEAVDFFTQIAERYSAEGFFVKAIAIYKKIIKLDPTRLEIYEQLAALYHKQGLVNEARTQYQVLADYYQKHENAASAIAIYQKMAQLEPDNPTYHVKLAEIYHQQQLTEKAMGEYRTIAELMLAHGRPQEAARVYERALDIDAGNIPFITDAALKLQEAGETAALTRLLAVAVERNPQAEKVARLVGLGRGVEAEPAPFEEVLPEAGREDWTSPVLTAEELLPPERLFDTGALGTPAGEEPVPSFEPEPAQPEEFELDLDDVFVLDLEDEDVPASLVKPPPDMLADGPRRPAWAQAAAEAPQEAPAPPALPELEPAPPLAAAPADELELAELPEFDLELDGFPDVALAEPAPELPEVEEGSQVFELDLDLEAGWELSPAPAAESVEPPAAEAQPPAEPQLTIDADLLERTAAELHPQAAPVREEDLVTEAEVLARYGLEEKAQERLREALRLNPSHLDAHALLIQLHLDKGRHARVVDLANQMSAVASRLRSNEPWQKMKRRLAAAGYLLDGERVAGPPPAPKREPAAAGVDQLLRGLIDQPAAKKRPAAPPPAAPPVPPAAPQPAAAVAPAPPAPAPPAAAPPAPVPAPPPPAAAGRASLPPPIMAFDLRQIGAEVEGEDLDDVGVSFPPPTAGESLAPPAPPTPGHEALDDTGMSWLDEADAGRAPASQGGDRLFEEEDDFFDLAAQIEEELSHEGVYPGEDLLVQPAEQSLEEIVEGFKKGVAESLSPTDYDTHFNLGIAYREMGLLDEAIGEFQLSAKDPGHLVACCSMLGLCFLDKGLPELAVKWYKRGLDAPRLSEEDTLGLLYDLGCAYVAMGDSDTAYKTFVEVYGINTNYRDVVARLEELGRPR